MSVEYGVFTEEGCIEAQFWNLAEVNARAEQIAEEYAVEGHDPDEIYTATICSAHEEQAADTCEECFADNEDVLNEQDGAS